MIRVAASRWDPRVQGATSRALLLVGGFAWGLWAVGTAFDEANVPTEAELGADLLVGLLMQWVGLFVWGRRGTGRTGPLLYVAGLLWYVGSIWDPPPLGAITFAWRSWYEPVLLAVILGWATGHLRRPADRLIVGALAGAYLVRSLVRMFVFDAAARFDDEALRNPFSIVWNEDLWHTVEDATLIVSAAVGAAVAITCVVRWRRASGAARRTLTPVMAAGAAMVPLLGWTAFTSRFSYFELPDWVPVFWMTIALRALVPIAILVGIVRLRTNTALSELLVALDLGVPVGRLEAVLASTLGDPSLRLAFPRAFGGPVDAKGHPVDLPTSEDRSMTAIEDDRGTAIAILVHDPALDEDPGLLVAAGAAARMSIENERLQAEVRAQLDEVRASRTRLVEASDTERRRVERDLHDGAQQRLVTLALQLNQARDHTGSADPLLAGLLGDATQELELAITELRELARGIHPAVLSRAGLGPAVTTLVERSPIPVSVSVTGDRCGAAVESTAYFVIAEALTNVARHSAAREARVVAKRLDGSLVLEVFDDGHGGADLLGGTGLRGLEDRVVAVGGQFSLDSRPGVGTTVRVVLPCE